MESQIDQKYRLLLLEHYLNDAKEGVLKNGDKKWVFICPFCGPLGRTEGRKKHLNGGLLWSAQQHSWVFSCAKNGSVECMYNKNFVNLISALNPANAAALLRHEEAATSAAGALDADSSVSDATTPPGTADTEEKPLPEYLSVLQRTDC